MPRAPLSGSRKGRRVRVATAAFAFRNARALHCRRHGYRRARFLVGQSGYVSAPTSAKPPWVQTFAYTLAQRGLADEIVLLDANLELAKGQVLDLAQGQAFFPSIQIRERQTQDYADASLLVITAGARPKPGETRLELVRRNAAIVESLMVSTRSSARIRTAVVLIVSNPVDILTYVAHKRSGWPRGRIMGYRHRARQRALSPLVEPALRCRRAQRPRPYHGRTWRQRICRLVDHQHGRHADRPVLRYLPKMRRLERG